MANPISSLNTVVARPAVRRQTDKRATVESEYGSEFTPPPRAHINWIPTPDALRSLIERALAALSRGVYWERGSIINILL